MVDRIIFATIQTGLLTLIFSGLDMLFYLMSPSGTYIILNFITSKLYSSSLLSSLNSRKGWGYDVSENTEEFELDTELGLRFAISPGSTVNRTSVAVSTSPVSELCPEKRPKSQDNSGVEHGQRTIKS